MHILKKISEIFRKIVIGYVFYTFPVTLIGLFICIKYHVVDLSKFLQPSYGVFINTLIQISGIQIAIWTLIAWLFSITMFFSKNNREIVLKKLSGIKERDEREVQVVGKALRASYLTTMTILLFLFLISLFHVAIAIESFDHVEPGKPPGYYSLGFQFDSDFLDPDAVITQKEGYDHYLELNGIPVTTPNVILILLVWQIVSFRVVFRMD